MEAERNSDRKTCKARLLSGYKKKIAGFICIIFLCITSNLFSWQNGNIKGKIIDEKTKQPLVGANVSIVGTMRGASTTLRWI